MWIRPKVETRDEISPDSLKCPISNRRRERGEEEKGREREIEMELENFIPPCPRCPFRPEYGLAARGHPPVGEGETTERDRNPVDRQLDKMEGGNWKLSHHFFNLNRSPPPPLSSPFSNRISIMNQGDFFGVVNFHPA